MRTNIWYFIRAVTKQWAALATSSAVAALVTLYEHRVGGTVPWCAYGWITAAYIIWASYSVWLAEARELHAARLKIAALEDKSRAGLILRFPFDRLGIGNPNDWIKLKNVGPGTALDIQIEPIGRGPYRATFEGIQILESGHEVSVYVTTCRGDEYHNVFSNSKINIDWFCELFRHDTKTLADLIEVPVTISYTDIHHKRRTAPLRIRCERPAMKVEVYCPTS